MSKKTSKLVEIDQLKETIDRKLIPCEHLVIWHQTEEPPYVNIRCKRDDITVEIWECIACLKLDIEDKFTHEQLYKGVTVPVIANQETLPSGVTLTHAYLMTEVCPLGYVCEDCDKAGPDLYYMRYCETHKAWVSQ